MGLIWLLFSSVSHLILPGFVKVIVSILPEEAMINTRKFWELISNSYELSKSTDSEP